MWGLRPTKGLCPLTLFQLCLFPQWGREYVLRIYYKDEYDVREDIKYIDEDEDEDIYEQFKIQAWLGDLIPTKTLYSR